MRPLGASARAWPVIATLPGLVLVCALGGGAPSWASEIDLMGHDQTGTLSDGPPVLDFVTLVTNTGLSPAVFINVGSSSKFSGVIRGRTSATGLTQNSAGNTLTLSGANTYSGPTTVAAGTLAAGTENAFSPNSPITVNSGAALDLGGFDQTVSSLSGGGLVTNNATCDAGPCENNLILTGPSSTTFAGVIGGGKRTALAFNSAGGTLDSDRKQHLHRRDDDQRRRTPARRWRNERIDPWRRRQRRRIDLRSRRQRHVRRRHQRNRTGDSGGRRDFDPDRRQHLFGADNRRGRHSKGRRHRRVQSPERGDHRKPGGLSTLAAQSLHRSHRSFSPAALFRTACSIA